MNNTHNDEKANGGKRYRDLGLAMSIPFMLATGPIVGWVVGRWLDARFGTNWLSLTMLVLGFIAGVRSVIRTLREDLKLPPALASRFEDDDKSEGNRYDDAKSDNTHVDAVEVDGVAVGTVSYTRRNRSGRMPGDPKPDDGPKEENSNPVIHAESDSAGNPNDAHPSFPDRHNLLSLPNIIASGIWITVLFSGVLYILANGEVALGTLAGGLWNLVNFAVLWLTFKTAFSKHPMRVFFTLPLVCIKIPLLYTLVVALYALKLFEPLGLTLGLLVLPAVVLFLAVLGNRSR